MQKRLCYLPEAGSVRPFSENLVVLLRSVFFRGNVKTIGGKQSSIHDIKPFCTTGSVGDRLVQGLRDDGVVDENLEGHYSQGGLVRGFEDDGASGPGALYLQPAGGTDAPAVSGLEPCESILRHGGAQVVAKLFGDAQKVFADDAADGVETEVFGAGLAAAGPVEAGHGLAAADIERLPQDILTARLCGFADGFDLCHSSFGPALGSDAANAVDGDRLKYDIFGDGRPRMDARNSGESVSPWSLKPYFL